MQGRKNGDGGIGGARRFHAEAPRDGAGRSRLTTTRLHGFALPLDNGKF